MGTNSNLLGLISNPMLSFLNSIRVALHDFYFKTAPFDFTERLQPLSQFDC